MDATAIDITPIESAEDPAYEQAFQIVGAAVAADLPDMPAPCWESFRGTMTHPWPGQPTRHFLARVDGVAAGYLELTLPDLDNTENATVEVWVHPQFRRRGVGRLLFDRAAAVARQEGRKRLIGDSPAALPGGVARTDAGNQFARSLGAKPALTEVRRRLDLATVDEEVLAEQLAEAWLHADGYSLVWWRDVVPGEYIDDVAYLDSRLVKDAPMGELAWEPEVIDRRRIRAFEAASRARKRRRYNTGVRHNATGRVVAFTTLDVEHCPADHAWQQVTIVEPQHRGHRLGTVVKIENLRYARVHEPALRLIDTWNAAENPHMIAINEQIGFRPVDSWINWQLDL
ncbi:MAG: GNAT family N-acetyltransferase [Micromonosporaceae bacterium]|jgi:GNAT superfamily N-acetyltransferase|nr:GNAT family N-acetyltransferase [Micromonosporaceae bacterium]